MHFDIILGTSVNNENILEMGMQWKSMDTNIYMNENVMNNESSYFIAVSYLQNFAAAVESVFSLLETSFKF